MLGINQKLVALGFIIIIVSLLFGCSLDKNTITGNAVLNDSVNIKVHVTNSKPQAPILIFPVDVYTFNKVRFAWQEAYDINSDPLSYNIQISDRPNFESVMINADVNRLTYEMPYDLDYRIYYFRVRANDGIDYGPFSKVATFGIKPPDNIPPAGNTSLPPVEYVPGQAIISQLDSDNDGVYDFVDQCSNTKKDSVVDIAGCACYQKNCDDTNACTDDYCLEDDAICRHYYNNTIKCGFFTQCPSDRCLNGDFYDYNTDYGRCLNGMCFENSCVAKITYNSETCGVKIFGEEITGEKLIPEEEVPYDEEQEKFDEDNDKVPDYKDKCQHSTVKFVDKYGCNCDQKRCVDLDTTTIDLCYRGRCVFVIKGSEDYNKTVELIDRDKEKPKYHFNFTLLGLAAAVIALFIIVFLIPSRKKEDENKDKQKTNKAENQNNTNENIK